MSVLAFPVQAQNFSLSGAGSSIGDVVLNLKSFKDILGANLTMTQFGSTGYGTIEAGNGVQEESISFTGITQNADGTAQLTGVKHALFIPPYTESSGMTITHPGSVVFIITNTSAWENSIYTYANTIASGGAPASSTVIGITRLTQDPAVAGTPIAIGSNTSYSGTAISTSNKAVDVASLSTTVASGKVVRALDATGLIDTSFLPTIGETGNSVLVKTKSTGKLDSSIITFPGFTQGVTSRQIDLDASNVTIAHGLGAAPRLVRLSACATAANSILISFGTSDGTNNTCVYATKGTSGTNGDYNSDTSYALILETDASASGQKLTITLDATNMTFHWTKFGSPSNTYTPVVLWEAYA